MIKLRILLLLIVAFLGACSGEQEGTKPEEPEVIADTIIYNPEREWPDPDEPSLGGDFTVYRKAYTFSFLEIEKFEAFVIAKNQIRLLFSGERIVQNSDDSVRFWEYARAYNDTSYNKEGVVSGFDFTLPHTCQSITVVSDADYDETHPAGTPLDDIVDIMAESAYEFIASNYTVYDNIRFETDLQRFNQKGMPLIGKYIYLHFSTAPSRESLHRFTIIWKSDAGTWEYKMKPVFIKI